jgi:hypothetical protein
MHRPFFSLSRPTPRRPGLQVWRLQELLLPKQRGQRLQPVLIRQQRHAPRWFRSRPRRRGRLRACSRGPQAQDQDQDQAEDRCLVGGPRPTCGKVQGQEALRRAAWRRRVVAYWTA